MSVTQNNTKVGIPKRYVYDKLNKVDYQWFVVRTQPFQEERLAGMLRKHREKQKNILEVYCPTHTTVCVNNSGKDERRPLFAGLVFVLSTQDVLVDFIVANYPEGTVMYDKRNEPGHKPSLLTIPEKQMRSFMDFNENFAEHVIILEKPYTDYAFNPKTNEPNEIVKIIDGPLAGREGYFVKFRRDKRLVFNMKSIYADDYMAVSIPNVWNYQVVRLHNAEGDRQTLGTRKDRAVDLLIGIIQGCGYEEKTLATLHEVIDFLTIKPSLVELCNYLYKHDHAELSRRIALLDTEGARLVMDLVRYERSNYGYVKKNWNKFIIRPFLTPTAGIDMSNGNEEVSIPRKDYIEILREVNITEQVYYPSKEKEELATTTYYAHIGIVKDSGEGCTLFANWDKFLDEYFMTEGNANESLVSGTIKKTASESFRDYAPILYKVLTDKTSRVKAVNDFKVGAQTLNVMSIHCDSDDSVQMEPAKEELLRTCVGICKEINTTTHLAVWRRYLRTVWLHQ